MSGYPIIEGRVDLMPCQVCSGRPLVPIDYCEYGQDDDRRYTEDSTGTLIRTDGHRILGVRCAACEMRSASVHNPYRKWPDEPRLDADQCVLETCQKWNELQSLIASALLSQSMSAGSKSKGGRL